MFKTLKSCSHLLGLSQNMPTSVTCEMVVFVIVVSEVWWSGKGKLRPALTAASQSSAGPHQRAPADSPNSSRRQKVFARLTQSLALCKWCWVFFFCFLLKGITFGLQHLLLLLLVFTCWLESIISEAHTPALLSTIYTLLCPVCQCCVMCFMGFVCVCVGGGGGGGGNSNDVAAIVFVISCKQTLMWNMHPASIHASKQISHCTVHRIVCVNCCVQYIYMFLVVLGP